MITDYTKEAGCFDGKLASIMKYSLNCFCQRCGLQRSDDVVRSKLDDVAVSLDLHMTTLIGPLLPVESDQC